METGLWLPAGKCVGDPRDTIARSGNDTLNGLERSDAMTGGLGNDIFFGDSTGNVVTEDVNQGTDTIQTRVTLNNWAANIENMTLR